MKIHIYMFLLICIILCVFSKDGDFLVTVSDSSKNVNELITNIYTKDELKIIESLDISLENLNNNYNIECLRLLNKNNYMAIFKGEDEYLFIVYDKMGNKKSCAFINANLSKKDFLSYSTSTLTEVMKLDKDGNYSFLWASGSEIEKISHHYTLDGYHILIHYDENHYVKNIEYKLL